MKPGRRIETDLHEADRRRNTDDEVTEAGKESFPASDPPAFNQAGPRSSSEPGTREQAPPRRGPNTSEVRERMASGRTMGKTSARDPAAAPFDTDDEAAGTAPSRPALVLEAEREKRETARRKSPMLPATTRIAIIAVLVLIAMWIAFT